MLLGILLTFLIIVCVCLVVVILMQRSEGGALGMGGSGNFLSTRGTGDLLTRTTQILGVIFFVLCLAITFLTGHTQGSGSVVDRANVGKLDPTLLAPKAPPPPAQPAPSTQPGGGFQAPTPTVGGPLGGAPADAPPASPFNNLPPAR